MSRSMIHIMLYDTKEQPGTLSQVAQMFASLFIPEDLIATQMCYDAMRLIQFGCVSKEEGLKSVQVAQRCSALGAEVAMREVASRAATTLSADGALHVGLKRLLKEVCAVEPTTLGCGIVYGLSRVLSEGATGQRSAAAELLVSLAGVALSEPVVGALIGALHQDPSESTRMVCVEGCGFLREQLARSSRLDIVSQLEHALAKSMSQDAVASIRGAAIEEMGPLGDDGTRLDGALSKRLVQRLSDRGGKVRERAALSLAEWGVERLTLTLSEWKDIALFGLANQQPKKVEPAIAALLTSLFRGPDALQWMRDLNLLNDTLFSEYLRLHGPDILPRLMIAASTMDDDEEHDDDCVIFLSESSE